MGASMGAKSLCLSVQSSRCSSFFFFQAEDGIRDLTVTGVQTCALPISRHPRAQREPAMTLARTYLAGMGAVIIALIVIVSGVIPIQASSGHWRATAWLLDLIKRQSVRTYSLAIVPPPLDQPSWIVRGGAHFETGCRPCHGSPLSPRPPFVMRMTPHPPELRDRIARWETRQLFQIVKHGIKFTAMPAWAAPQRADEIWAIVAFLQKLPSLNQESYRDLAFGETSTSDGVSVVERCARCHGADGMGRGGSFPVLAGQRPEYLTNALLAYREDRRHSGIMRPEAFELDNQARKDRKSVV